MTGKTPINVEDLLRQHTVEGERIYRYVSFGIGLDTGPDTERPLYVEKGIPKRWAQFVGSDGTLDYDEEQP